MEFWQDLSLEPLKFVSLNLFEKVGFCRTGWWSGRPELSNTRKGKSNSAGLSRIREPWGLVNLPGLVENMLG
uniref:Uncharacterized protein MANES_06G019300 n=1 Tax=Rhizophora mucronata TaxID=61149 RepID=A0A2P2IJ10_RHIMU